MSKTKVKSIEVLLEEVLVPEEEQLYDVPSNWVWSTLGNIIELAYGKALPQKDRIPGTYPIYGSNGVVGAHETYLVEGPSIIVGRKGSNGEVNWSESSCWPIDTTYFVKTKHSRFDLRYVYYLLKTLGLKSLNRSTAIPGLNREDAYKIKVAVPPVQEQKRIVNKIEMLFTKIDAANRLIDEAKETFELRRAAILDKAFRGELTREWRARQVKLENPMLRYNRIKNERLAVVTSNKEKKDINNLFSNYELNGLDVDKNGWVRIEANMFCHNINCGGTPTGYIAKEGEVPFLKVYNIVNNKIDFDSEPQYIPSFVSNQKLAKSRLFPGDVVMNIVGPPLKKIAVIPEEFPEWNMNQAIVRFRPLAGILSKYIYYCLQYDKTLEDIMIQTRGVVGQVNISVSQSRAIVMPIPSLEEQSIIVNLLDSILSQEEDAISSLNNQLDYLKQSILTKAFRGGLGTNNPREESSIDLLLQVLKEKVI